MSGIKEAALRLGLSEPTVRLLMIDGAIDIGYVIERNGRNSFYVIPELLEKEVKRLGKTQGV